MATGLRVFPYGLRVMNFLAVSDSPINFSEARWTSVLRQYRIDNQLVFDPLIFDPSSAKSEETLATYVALARALDKSKEFQSLGKRQWQTVLTPWFAEILRRVFGCCLGQVG